MKRLFYFGLAGLALFEILKVYFIMPMPGSQQINSLDLAYSLHTYRWYLRVLFTVCILAGSFAAFGQKLKWVPVMAGIPVLIIVYYSNFQMTAEYMFLQPRSLVFKSRAENLLSDSSLVLAVSHSGQAKAYPIRWIQYHHQVRDTIAGRQIMVTYCNVCRTGRVYEPFVEGKYENFRLVGMDHFNAMFEDATTKSWWQQSTGKSIAGELKGRVLPEVESTQLTLSKFFSLYPFGQVMQPEMASKERYDTLGRFEKGKSRGELTRMDAGSWKDKSWVVGIEFGNNAKAYDWNDLKKLRVIHDRIGDTLIVLALSADNQSFVAFTRSEDDKFNVRNDSLVCKSGRFDFAGNGTNGKKLNAITVYQEFWHSWKTFHPETDVYVINDY
jgi:hypothetical protein